MTPFTGHTTRDKHICPACRREFRSVLDYPRVRVVALEELPIPEAVDRHSEAAAPRRRAGLFVH